MNLAPNGGIKMEKDLNYDKDYYFFSSRRFDDVITLYFKGNMLFRTIDLHARDILLDYFDRISRSDLIKVVVIIGFACRKKMF